MLGALNGWKSKLGLTCCLAAAAVALRGAPGLESLDGPGGQVLTNAAQLRTIPAIEAARQLPVKLRGVVTAVTPRAIFLQDATGGTFINIVNDNPEAGPGDVLEVEGVTYAGRFVTGIRHSGYRKVGHQELPPGQPVDFDELLSGRRHYERVEVKGIVRSVE